MFWTFSRFAAIFSEVIIICVTIQTIATKQRQRGCINSNYPGNDYSQWVQMDTLGNFQQQLNGSA